MYVGRRSSQSQTNGVDADGRRKGRRKREIRGRKGEGEGWEDRIAPPIGDSGSSSGRGEGKEKGKEGRLGWVV